MGGTTHIHLLGYQTKKIKRLYEVGRGHVESYLEGIAGVCDHISLYTLKFSKTVFLERK